MRPVLALRRQHRRTPWVGRALVATAGLAAVVTVAGLAADLCLRRRLAGYAASGEPVSMAGLPRFLIAVPPALNSASRFGAEFAARGTYLTSIAATTERAGLPFLDVCTVRTGLDTEELRHLAALYLTRHRAWLATVHAASAYPWCGSEAYRGSPLFADIRQPLTAAVADGVACLCLEALWQASEGQSAAAVETLAAGWALGRQLLAEPFTVNVVTTICCERQVLSAAELLCASGTCGPEQRDRLLALCTPVPVAWVQRALQMERLAGLEYYYQRQAPAGAGDAHSLGYLGLLPKVVACRLVEEYLDYTDACVRLFDLPLPCQAAVAGVLVRTHYRPGANPLLALVPSAPGLARMYARYTATARRLDAALRSEAPGPLPRRTVAAASGQS